MRNCRNGRCVEGGSWRGGYLHHPQNRTLSLDGHNDRRTQSQALHSEPYRESSSVSSQIITCPLSKHSLVRLDSGWSREPTSGASPALARQTTPQASRRAMAAPSASVSERTRSITPFKTIDRGRSLFSFISLSISPNSISALFWALVAPRTLALMLGSWALRLGIECSHSFGG